MGGAYIGNGRVRRRLQRSSQITRAPRIGKKAMRSAPECHLLQANFYITLATCMHYPGASRVSFAGFQCLRSLAMCRSRVVRHFVLAVGVLGMALPAWAERIEPPLELLRDPVNLLIAGKAVEINAAAGRIVFECKTILAGNRNYVTQDLIDTRVPTEILDKVVVGNDYIFGYSLFIEDPRRPGKLIGKREGATMLVSPGVEPALFADTPEVRKLLEAGRNEHSRESRSMLNLLVATLKSKNSGLQNLAANQLALAPELRAKLRSDDRRAIEAFVRDPDAPALARTPLLEAAAQHPDAYGEGWALDTSQSLLSTTPVDGFNDKTSDLETLLRVAFSLSGQSPGRLPEASLVRWVRSSSVVLAEPALRLLHQWYPQAERQTVEGAVQDSGTPSQTRIFLRGYLQRMNGTGNAVQK
jgi:hypothetical protein